MPWSHACSPIANRPEPAQDGQKTGVCHGRPAEQAGLYLLGTLALPLAVTASSNWSKTAGVLDIVCSAVGCVGYSSATSAPRDSWSSRSPIPPGWVQGIRLATSSNELPTQTDGAELG